MGGLDLLEGGLSLWDREGINVRPQNLDAASNLDRRKLALGDVSPKGLIRAEAKFDGIGEVEVMGEVGRVRRGVPHDNSRQLELSGDGE